MRTCHECRGLILSAVVSVEMTGDATCISVLGVMVCKDTESGERKQVCLMG